MELIVLRDGEEYRVAIEHDGQEFSVTLGDESYLVDSVSINGPVRSLIIKGRQYELAVRRKSPSQYVVSHLGSVEEVEVLDPLTYLATEGSAQRKADGPQEVTAYMPGRVVKVLVTEGEAVLAGQGLVILEAMKMENEIQAEHDGVIRRVLVADGQPVEGGDPLFEIE